jgi:hypothetical protein
MGCERLGGVANSAGDGADARRATAGDVGLVDGHTDSALPSCLRPVSNYFSGGHMKLNWKVWIVICSWFAIILSTIEYLQHRIKEGRFPIILTVILILISLISVIGTCLAFRFIYVYHPNWIGLLKENVTLSPGFQIFSTLYVMFYVIWIWDVIRQFLLIIEYPLVVHLILVILPFAFYNIIIWIGGKYFPSYIFAPKVAKIEKSSLS